VINANWDPDSETEAIHNLVSRSIDGIIFVESHLRGPNPTLDLANKPYVFVHRLFNSSVRNSVAVDERYGVRLAMQHLLAMGHRRIAYINGPRGWEAAEERFRAYQEVLEEAGIAYQQDLVEQGDWISKSGKTATENLLELSDRPTAIFAANDLMALGAIYAIQDAGMNVPGDIAVVGYDDREIASQARPGITTVTLPCYELGQASAQLLLRLLDNQEQVEESIRIRGRLIVRESCGAADGKQSSDDFDPRTTPRQQLYSQSADALAS
jgi:LacI family transcriptional regulator